MDYLGFQENAEKFTISIKPVPVVAKLLEKELNLS
jgi:hypothetical protein